MEKWHEPKTAPPPWLDPERELVAHHDVIDRAAFVVQSMDACLALGCDPHQAAGVVANAINESAWGQAFIAWNLFGWKITKAYADAYRAAHAGQGPPWWRAPGNKAPGATLADLKGGDPPWCWYRAFGSLQAAYAEWIAHFVPRPGADAPYPAYKATGAAFWAGDAAWFELLCRVGYKGSNTQRDPSGAIAEHASLVHAALTRWVQSKLGVTPDGVWGPMSRAACLAYQAAHGLAPSGLLDDVLSPLASDCATLA